MGTATLLEEIVKSTDGQTFHIAAWCNLSDFQNPEFSWVGITVTPDGSEDPAYRLHVCLADYTEKWMKRWVLAFRHLPEYRKQFAVEDSLPHSNHPATLISLDGNEVFIDTRILFAIQKLNNLGIKTKYCCQGGGGSLAYIQLQPGSQFPLELMQAWDGAKFNPYLTAVFAEAQAGLEDVAAELFCNSLYDWMAGNLDASGMRYRVTINRPSTLPHVPEVKKSDSEINQAVRKLLKLGKKARFSDFAALRSGRDKFSNIKLPELLEMINLTTEIVAITGLPTEDQAKVARWYLRGLPIDISIHKVNVDKEISDNAHSRRTKKIF